MLFDSKSEKNALNYDYESVPLEAAPAFPATFACILLSRTDRIRISGFPEHVITALDTAISQGWPAGVQNQGPYQSAYEWKLSGNPWTGYGAEAISGRRLIVAVIQALAATGWWLHSSCDLTKNHMDKDSLFFKASPPVHKSMFSISFNESDKIRLITDASIGENVATAFKAAFSVWKAGVQNVSYKAPDALQVKLRGNPWLSRRGVQIIETRILACNLLSAMNSQGYDLIGSVDMKTGNSETGTLDTWIFASK